ncbi:hypothetical protein GGE65_000797 [Skermanella aerolata]|uniref:hypothetical protein n=1 Tax=Skermanella aerolata TaxID=393310 RepID=UPI003D23225E
MTDPSPAAGLIRTWHGISFTSDDAMLAGAALDRSLAALNAAGAGQLGFDQETNRFVTLLTEAGERS